MPLFARRLAMAVIETGEVIAVLSECSQRIRGKSLLCDPSSKENNLVCYETPHRNERLGWFLQTRENQAQSNPTVTPVFILNNDAKNGANPKTIHYLRDAQGLELTYFPTTKEVQVQFWWNLYTPTQTIPDRVPCVPFLIVPQQAGVTGDWAVYQDPGGTVLKAIDKPVDQVSTFPPPLGPYGQPITGVFGRKGMIVVDLGVDPGGLQPSPEMAWKSVAVRVVLARREVPDSSRETLKLPHSKSSKPDAGTDPLNGPYRDGNPEVAIRLAGVVAIGKEIQPLSWDFQTGTGNPYVLDVNLGGNPQSSLTVFSATGRFQVPHQETTLRIQFEVYIDNMYIPLDYTNSDGYTSLYIAAIEGTLLCSTSEEGNLNTFYSTYKNTPITFTLPLDQYEPHAFQRVTEDAEFNYAIGDPPLDVGGAWAGIYNRANYLNFLSVGGASPGKDIDPFQFTDAHKSLPSDPGLIQAAVVQRQAALINLTSISDSLDDYTQHLYHQREIQASRMSTRVLMQARGTIQDLILREEQPGDDDVVVTQFGGLTIGFSALTPAVVSEQYQGENSVAFVNTEVLYPFGAALPGFVSLTPGELGHQFTANGGTPPYSWCLRRTRSSFIDTARVPIPVGHSSVPYPFDPLGNLIPDIPFPPATQGGGMPPGMLLDQNGLFYGTPTQAGTYLFRVHVQDSVGLHGEATVRLLVLADEFLQKVPCSQSRGFPVTFKTTITRTILPPIDDFMEAQSWRGKVRATGGQTGKYLFFFPNPNDPPRQLVPSFGGKSIISLGVSDGEMALSGITQSNFDAFLGVWLFDIQATELVSGASEKTCDIRAVALSIGTTRVAGIEDPSPADAGSTIPEGAYQAECPVRSYLVLDPPVPVRAFIHGKNTYLQGNSSSPLRPDLGWKNVNPAIVTSIAPGSVNPVQIIGIGVEEQAPSFYHLDWLRSNPVAYFRDIVDRFDPIPVSLPPESVLPPGSPPASDVTGASIDDQIPIGKRIRPLWPV